MKSLRPVIVKEFRQIRRDPTSLGMLLVLPAALIGLVGYALTFDLKHAPVAVLDRSGSPESRQLRSAFDRTEEFDVALDVQSYREIEQAFDRGSAKLALVIPSEFAADLAAGREAVVQIIVDGADNTTAGQALGQAIGITRSFSAGVVARALESRGAGASLPVDFRPRVWYNPDLLSSRFLVPGLIGFILVLTGVVSTSLSVVREKERGTMEQILVSPLHPVQVVLGKAAPYMLIGLVSATVILLIGRVLFGISVAGSILLLYAAILLLILASLGQGLLISTATDSQQVAFMVSVFSSLLPSFLLSGFVFPVSNMPLVLQVLSNIAVNKFFLVIVRSIMLKGAGFAAVWEQFLFMALFAALTLGVSAIRLRRTTL
jgi:ABC-2 type transport system permease protein